MSGAVSGSSGDVVVVAGASIVPVVNDLGSLNHHDQQPDAFAFTLLRGLTGIPLINSRQRVRDRSAFTGRYGSLTCIGTFLHHL
jgi:hypothetical protein